MSDTMQRFIRLRQAQQGKPGQGVVEYAGALVIAAVIVAMGLTVVPPGISGYLGQIQAGILQFLLSHTPA